MLARGILYPDPRMTSLSHSTWGPKHPHFPCVTHTHKSLCFALLSKGKLWDTHIRATSQPTREKVTTEKNDGNMQDKPLRAAWRQMDC